MSQGTGKTGGCGTAGQQRCSCLRPYSWHFNFQKEFDMRSRDYEDQGGRDWRGGDEQQGGYGGRDQGSNRGGRGGQQDQFSQPGSQYGSYGGGFSSGYGGGYGADNASSYGRG